MREFARRDRTDSSRGGRPPGGVAIARVRVSRPQTDDVSRCRVNDASQQVPTSREDEIRLIDLWWIVWERKVLVAVTIIIGALVALFLALTATPLYRSTAVLTEVQESPFDVSSGLSGVGGLASLGGLGLGGNGPHPERQAVLKSRHLVEEFVKRPDVFPLLVSGEKDAKKRSLWMTVEMFRRNVLDIVDDKLKGTTTVTMDWKNAAVAARWAAEIVTLSNQLLRDSAIDDATRNVAFLKDLAEHTNSVELQKVMYRLIEQETRKLMLAKGRMEYAFAVADPPVTAEVRISPRRTLTVLSGIAVGGFLGCYIAWLRTRFAPHH
ncbi:MAG: hypothetical protein E6G39_21060 [Actinobacteria bacterium]|nr:MAG: hypothetical protein E6G39_21060 [Actinomycetota bacterium]